MTEKEKAVAYDEAIKRAKKSYGNRSAEEIFPELKESEDERIRGAILNGLIDCRDAPDLGWSNFGGIPIDDCIAWLEKQGKNSTNKTPRFKVSDWVVDNCSYIWKIERILNQFYILKDTEGSESQPTIDWVDNTFHLWTFQDAKDGDVLVNGSNIFIFYFINNRRLMGYCHVNMDDGNFYNDIGRIECFCTIDASVTPATKEQRDALMKAMNEAGYEWDAEKKELKNKKK